MTQVSHSRVEGFLSCERRDFYSYTLGLKRRKDDVTLRLGTAGHACLAALYSTILAAGSTRSKQRAAWGRGVKALWAKYDELVAAGWKDEDPSRWPLKTALENYLANERIVLAGWRVLAVEKEFHVRFDDEGNTILFVVDLIAETAQKRQAVIDHKFVWDFTTDRQAELMGQLPKYVGMLRFLGYHAAEAYYSMIRTRKINGEAMLKPDLVSALYNHYGQEDPPEAMAAWARDLPKMKVSELQTLCEVQGIEHTKPVPAEKLYQLLPVPLETARIKRTLQEQFLAAERIIERDKLPVEQLELRSLRTNDNMTHDRCPFRALCVAELNARDTRLIMEDFTHRDPRELPELDGED